MHGNEMSGTGWERGGCYVTLSADPDPTPKFDSAMSRWSGNLHVRPQLGRNKTKI